MGAETNERAAHTPGPWETNGVQVFAHVGQYGLRGRGIHVASVPVGAFCGVDGPEESRANARLMAAAPDLLAACERSIAALDANGAPNCEAAKEARAAIAKARGRA